MLLSHKDKHNKSDVGTWAVRKIAATSKSSNRQVERNKDRADLTNSVLSPCKAYNILLAARIPYYRATPVSCPQQKVIRQKQHEDIT